ncbi:MAG: indolepyruvate ferredoxin oxidoreductase subunit beta [Candidatus Hodarchaeales archaeon]|jgi:indolepyruvate ferredoxin oxidoreductase beta subunit
MSPTNLDKYEIVLCGVGGQGILTVTDIICNTALQKGLKVRGSETHGMAQRGGSVMSNIRIGKDIHAPLIPERSADVILALEPIEALRYARYVKPDGCVIFNNYTIPPPNLNLDKKEYPPIDKIIENLKDFTDNFVQVNATKLAEQAGAIISQNIVLLGAFAALEGSPITKDDLLAEMKRYIKSKFVEMNLTAFESGYKATKEQLKKH